MRRDSIEQSRRVVLTEANDYTATVDFEDLTAGIDYAVLASFSPARADVAGRLCTMQRARPEAPDDFSFVLSSCNLSVVSINNFLSALAATAGTGLANSSLDLPFERWKAPRAGWLRPLLRRPLRLLLGAVAKAIKRFTAVKQPGPPYLRSPFLKLSAVFESVVLEITYPDPAGRVLSDNERSRRFVAVGERVHSSGGASGVVASLDPDPGVVRAAAPGDPGALRPAVLTGGRRRLVLTQVSGQFRNGETLRRDGASHSDNACDELGPISGVAAGLPWFDPPSFFVHAGDQIYFDFPDPRREPHRAEYRLAYREAWFEDAALRYLLARWPHYMTLDDHEIADQFDLAFIRPNDSFGTSEYLHEASVAYSEYAHALAPQLQNKRPAPAEGPYWYEFEKGTTQFFVMDTRTCRDSAKGQIIDPPQMARLLEWMVEHASQLKFVVTSVPFVAEVSEAGSNQKDDWFKSQQPGTRQAVGRSPTPGPLVPGERNSEQDKWSARCFERQRGQIIEHIAAHRIEHLVFLAGDMHCCYHATMRIGGDLKKYQAVTVHELAGGPVNQLQLASVDEFERRRARRSAGPGEPVDYEVVLERFHGDVSAVMHLAVKYSERAQVTTGRPVRLPEVNWSVIRTLTDPGPAAWTEPAGRSGTAPEVPLGESVMAGTLSFVQSRRLEDLAEWPRNPASTRAVR